MSLEMTLVMLVASWLAIACAMLWGILRISRRHQHHRPARPASPAEPVRHAKHLKRRPASSH
jgi:hypothetical protein